MKALLIIFLLTFIQLLLIAVTGSISTISCVDYGYNPTTLTCSTCEIVGQILGDQSEAKLKCQECCLNILQTEEKYEKAILELDQRSLPYFPDLQAIIDKKKELRLIVRYRYGSPKLSMYKYADDDMPSETIGVHAWSKETFQDYLSSYLVKPSVSS